MSDTTPDVAPEETPETPEVPEVEAPVEPNSVDELPEWAQKLISDVRAEAAKHRTEKTSAAEQARQAALDEAAAKAKELSDAKTALESELSATKLAALKERVALQAGVPVEKAADFADLLKGETEEELTAYAEKVRDLAGIRPLAIDPTQGAAGPDVKTQLSKEDLQGMSPAQINQARVEGRLNNLLGRN
jgi:hypothetical protein